MTQAAYPLGGAAVVGVTALLTASGLAALCAAGLVVVGVGRVLVEVL